jgi:chemotaxis protein CheD
LNVRTLDGELSAGIGEYKIGKNILLKVMGLGSCIGVILSDVSTGICGIAHVLLPGASNAGEAKYAETAIEKMFEDMVKMGARKSRITAKFAGGAQVFKHMNLEILKIGDRNAISVEEALVKRNIPILAKDVGGEVGRNVIFNPMDGSMIVKYTKGDILWL